LVLGVALVIAACARVRPLEGGPADVRAPRLVRASPADSSVGLSRRPRIVVEFDEPVAAATVRRSIRVQPPVRLGDIDIDGARVSIELADSLPADTTVVVVLGTAIQDLPGRDNRLPQEIALTYSTGPRLRAAAVAGRVTARDKPDRRVVVTWQPVAADTLPAPAPGVRPGRGPTAEVSTEGLFRLGGIPPGQPFRLVAFVDVNDDLRPQADELRAAYPETLVVADGETRRGLSWNIVDPDAPAEWTGVALNQSAVPGPVAVALRRLDAGSAADSIAGRDTVRTGTPALPSGIGPGGLAIAPRDSSAWGAAYAALEASGFRRREWTLVYASPRGDYSMRVPPGRVLWLAFVDAQRDSLPGLYAVRDSARLDWEPLVFGDTVLVAPGERLRRRTIEIR
jgi:hypothetical protein